jgi:NarL family two-component system response regulator LiaR
MEAKPGAITLGIVNDFPIVSAGLRELLEPYSERVSVHTFVHALPSPGEIDVLLYDPYGQPSPNERLKEIIDATGSKVIVFGWAIHQSQVQTALRLGAAGFLSKTVDAQEIIAAVETVSNGGSLQPDPILGAATMVAWPGQAAGLTEREAEIVTLITAGLSNMEIAKATYLSINSVKTYIRTAYRKMAVTSRPEAVLWGVDNGMRPPPTSSGD